VRGLRTLDLEADMKKYILTMWSTAALSTGAMLVLYDIKTPGRLIGSVVFGLVIVSLSMTLSLGYLKKGKSYGERSED
jgi:membrane protein implicated in regulation of membrane protease activity